MATSEVIKLENVRLSFPSLFNRRSFGSWDGDPKDDPNAKFQATCLLDPERNAAGIKAIKAAAASVVGEQWPGKELKGVVKALKGMCFGDADRDGREYDGWEGQFYVLAKNSERPDIRDRSGNPVAKDDNGAPYAGCYVNAFITLWTQDNQWGKRINANLLGVQMRADGEAFSSRPNIDDQFEDYGDQSGSESNGDPLDDDDDDSPF